MSDKETTENFWKVWSNFVWPEPKPISYRLYYRDDGFPDFYTMEDVPGNYIEVSQQIYINAPGNVRVVNGKLVVLPIKKIRKKLVPDPTVGTKCHAQDVCVVVNTDQPGNFWKIKDLEIS